MTADPHSQGASSKETLVSLAKAAARGDETPGVATEDFASLVVQARALRCLPLVAEALSTLPNCPRELTGELERSTSGAWAVHMMTHASFGPILSEAFDSGIAVVVYKGAAQASRYYRHQFGRPMLDIDLLVSRDQEAAFHQILFARGFQLLVTPGRSWTSQVGYESTFTSPVSGARTIDVHTAPTPPARYPMPIARMLARSVSGTLFDAPVRFLAPEDELLVMAVNQAYDHFRSGFIRLLDAWLITTQEVVDWDRLVYDARVAGAGTALWLTLLSARRVACAPVPQKALDRLKPDWFRRTWLEALLDTDDQCEPRHQAHRRIEQLLLAYPLIDRPLGFARFTAYHGGLRLLDFAQQAVDRLRGAQTPPSE